MGYMSYFFFNCTATTEIYTYLHTLSLHDALPILVPMNKPGIEITPVHTFMDERNNATFYSDVRVEDKYRLGEINGGAKVLASAPSMEQSGGYYHILISEMADTVADWAGEEQRDGNALIEKEGVLEAHGTAYAAAKTKQRRGGKTS